jgi:hypothetical protein
MDRIRHENTKALLTRNQALLERVTVLERALEKIAETDDNPFAMRAIANQALNSERLGSPR